MCRTQRVLVLIALFVGLAYSWDFVISKENILEFYTNNGTKTASFILDSKLKSIVYNEVVDMVVYVVKYADGDRICGYYIAANETRCFTEANGRDIRGLAFDAATELLFFTDTSEGSINWISFKPGSNNNIYGNLLIQTGDVIPTDIAVDSCRGYIYWINADVWSSTIERARFNGSEREQYFHHNRELHSLVIDQVTQKLYVMAHVMGMEHIVRYTDVRLVHNFTDLNTVNYYSSNAPSTNTLAVSKTFLYSVNWCTDYCESGYVRKLPKTSTFSTDFQNIWLGSNSSINGITANYKIKDNYQDLPNCEPLTKYVQNNFGTSNGANNAAISNNFVFLLRLFLLVFLM